MSTVYEPDEYESNYLEVTTSYNFGSLSVPGVNQADNDYGFEYVFGGSPIAPELGAGIYKISLDNEVPIGPWGTETGYPYFYFDYRDQDFNLGYPYATPDIRLHYDYTNSKQFKLQPNTDPGSAKIVEMGELITNWDVLGNNPPEQGDYEAISAFNLGILWSYTGHPYLYWNQTTPQGTQYEVYRKVCASVIDCKTAVFQKIYGPTARLQYTDRDIRTSGSYNVSYFVKTTSAKISNTVSLDDVDFAPLSKQQKFHVANIYVEQEFEITNHPNPFNPVTQINYRIPVRSRVTLTIYNLHGSRVVRLVDKVLHAASHQSLWDGTDTQGRPVPSGAYLYRLEARSLEDNQVYTETKKMVLVR